MINLLIKVVTFCVNLYLINARVDIMSNEARGFKPKIYENALQVKGKLIQEVDNYFEFHAKIVVVFTSILCCL